MSQFPSIYVSEKSKNEDYHREFVTAICKRSLNSNYALQQSITDSCYNFYNGTQGSASFEYLQKAEDGSSLPAQWMTLNKIRSKVNLLIGELMEKGYDFRVSAINKEAKSRKLQEKEKMRVDVRLQPIFQELEQTTSMPSPMGQNLPETEEEVDEFFDKNYKEISEIVLYYAIKYIDKKTMWNSERTSLFRDILIAGKAFAKTEIVNGIPRVRRIDPRYVVYDTYAENDYLTDSTYFGEVRYMNAADAAVKYNVSVEDLKKSAQSYQDYIKYMQKSSQERMSQLDINFPSLGGSNLNWFEQTPSGLRVLVMDAYWVDYKVIKNKVSEDNYGNEHIKEISDSARDKENVISKMVKVWRKATLIGGDTITDWGLVKNQPRDVDNLSETYPPFCALIPHFVNGRSVSIVEQLQSLQNMKDIITYNISLSMARAGAKGFVYDVSQCPDTWEPEDVIRYLKTVGIAFIDSRAGGVPAQFNQFQQIDLSLSDSVRQYLELTRWVDMEMDQISGISEARQGIMQGASQLASVTQSALIQSSLTTASYFKMFEQFSTNIWNQIAKLTKIAWAGKERFAPIIGDAGVNFLEQDIELDLNDYAVFVESTPKLLDDLNSFQQMIMAGLQSGDLRFGDAMKLLMEKDVVSGILKYEKLTAKREKEQAAQEQQMMMQQEQMKMQAQQQMAQFNAQTSQTANEKALQVQQLKNQGALQQKALDSRTKLRSEQIKGVTQLATTKEQSKNKKPNE